MSLTGSGNTWDKKNKYSKCPKCKKKGLYIVGGFIGEEFIRYKKCKYCDYTEK